ncbi:MAG TPA: hypothetical protein VHH52_05820, partial [Pseudonocardiaceae bacterium]|nr:hypothetical protein [Pseudonocardiaceae bacterium]
LLISRLVKPGVPPCMAQWAGMARRLPFTGQRSPLRSGRGPRMDGIPRRGSGDALVPQWSRVQPLGHTVVGQLVERRGRRSERIAELAAHYGAR